jgi:hypothetical protein
VLVLIALMLGGAWQGAPERLGYVPFCEIVQHPERYDQKSVLTSGVYQAGDEFADFLDPQCATTADRDVGTLPVPERTRVQDSPGWKRMSSIVKRDRRAFVVVRGVFDAYRRYEGPLPRDPKLQEIVKDGGRRFGHLDLLRFRLRIEQVEFVAPVHP